MKFFHAHAFQINAHALEKILFLELSTLRQYTFVLKWGASSRLSFDPNSAWGSIETTTIGKAHPTLHVIRFINYYIYWDFGGKIGNQDNLGHILVSRLSMGTSYALLAWFRIWFHVNIPLSSSVPLTIVYCKRFFMSHNYESLWWVIMMSHSNKEVP